MFAALPCQFGGTIDGLNGQHKRCLPAKTYLNTPVGQVRDEVVGVWRHRQALKLAQKEAEAIAEKARKRKAPLKDQFGNKVKLTNQFSWMTSFDQNIGMAQPFIMDSQIEGVDQAGEDFKETVFSLDFEKGEVGVALNQPKTAAYVIRILYETADKENRTIGLLRAGPPDRVIGQLASRQDNKEYLDWLQSVEKEMQLEWVETDDDDETEE